MGSLDGAEISELIGVYLLNKIKEIIPLEHLGLYRDDGLAVFEGINGQKLDKIRKKLHTLFGKEGLRIKVELHGASVDYLEVELNLADRSYKPYKKPNDTPAYIHTKSNHPPNIIKNIPSMISKRLSNISSTKRKFDETKHDYEAALKRSGYPEELSYQEPTLERKKRCRKRKIIWYNPPFSSNVSTNIGRKFFTLLEKHFPKNNPLHKLFNKNTIKIS